MTAAEAREILQSYSLRVEVSSTTWTGGQQTAVEILDKEFNTLARASHFDRDTAILEAYRALKEAEPKPIVFGRPLKLP